MAGDSSADAGGPHAAKVTLPDPSAPAGELISVGNPIVRDPPNIGRRILGANMSDQLEQGIRKPGLIHVTPVGAARQRERHTELALVHLGQHAARQRQRLW